MGVDLQTYRARIGTFRHYNGEDVLTISHVVNFSQGLKYVGCILFIGILLIMACVEQNPGPRNSGKFTMGVDLQTYRARIGTFRHCNGEDVLTISHVVNFSQGLKYVGCVLFIGILLIMACVEQNPGPRNSERESDLDDAQLQSDALQTGESKMFGQQFANAKNRNWIKAALGFKYVKEGLESFCDEIVKRQHADILHKVKQKPNQTAAACDKCKLKTLRPDHVRTKERNCELGQQNCNCQHPGGKVACPDNVCGKIYDQIINLHESKAPNWKNTEVKLWCSQPWAIAKCFINAPGYEMKSTPSEIDCSGLLHVLINNTGLHIHLTEPNLFCKVRKNRNTIFHGANMEIEDTDAVTVIDDMIAVLQDNKELEQRSESHSAVQELLKLKKHDFTITNSMEAEVKAERKALIELGQKINEEIEHKRSEVKTDVIQIGSDVKAEITQTGSEVKTEIKQTGNLIIKQIQDTSSQASESSDISLKKEFQTKLIDLYKRDVIKISPLPLLPDENCTDIVDIYVPPLMTIERRDMRQSTEVSVHDIFKIQGKSEKLIYVLGEAGSGKSSFCKYLVKHWCVAHSGKSCHEANENLVEEMKNFLYLFYFSLRHLSDYHSIKEMLEVEYQDEILCKVLQKESQNCLIVLDGLDEWTPRDQKSTQFSKKGLPTRNCLKDYTILTTSRQWKVNSLQIKKSEMDKTIKLKGLSDNSFKDLICKTVDILNEKFKKQKDANDCITYINKGPFAAIRIVPMLLQQLTCLWFDDKLTYTSKCTVYSSMLELFFEWAAQKDADCGEEESNNTSNKMTGVELPEGLTDYKECSENKHVIISLSRLAYETLLGKSQENCFTSLTFTRSTLERLHIPEDMTIRSLHIGILSEDRAIALQASRRQQSSFSFIHKSVQEYLAAVFIAIQFENMTKSLESSDQNDEIGKTCLNTYLVRCSTVDDILEQSNVLIMLCGLKPQLAGCICKYIYDIVAVDGRVKDYRTTISLNETYYNNEQLITAIESCIMSCLKEAKSSARSFQLRIYLEDIIMSHSYTQLDEIITLALQDKNIVLDSVTSLCLYRSTFLIEDTIETLTHCKNLRVLRYSEAIFPSCGPINNDNIVAAIVVNNVSTLRILDITPQGPAIDVFLKHLPTMHNLTSLRIGCGLFFGKFSHDQCIALSRSITQNTRLQEMSMNIKCEQHDRHVVNLSKHEQLQHIEFSFSFMCNRKLNIDKLVTCIVTTDSVDKMIQMRDSLYNARNLIHLNLSNVLTKSAVAEWQNVTASVIRLLPSLTSLSTLMLRSFTFTDNIITCPADMKNLKGIILSDVVMSETTMCNFIDCLPEIPRTVQVEINRLKITPVGKECDMEYLDSTQANDPVSRYVREKTSLFHVTDVFGCFSFSTLKS